MYKTLILSLSLGLSLFICRYTSLGQPGGVPGTITVAPIVTPGSGGSATNVDGGTFSDVTLTGNSTVPQAGNATTVGGLTVPQIQHSGSNILWLSELVGNDTTFEWGNPAKPVKTLTNAIYQAQVSFLNSKATIFAMPETYACSNHAGITFTNLDLTIIAWGAQFNGWLSGLTIHMFEVGTNSVFKHYGGTYDFTSDFYNNGGHPFDIEDSTNVYLFGVTVRAPGDNFFWTTRTPAQWTVEYCNFTGAWDMNQITLTGPGTNTVFTVRNSSFTKDKRELGNVIWNAIRMNVSGVLRVENCIFTADHPSFTNSMNVISPARTNFLKNVTISMAGSGTLNAFDSMPVNSTQRQYRFENVYVYPDNNPFNSASSFFSFASTTLSNITARGGYYGGSNSVANWPTAAKTPGGYYIGNSNAAVYILTSATNSTAWINTNRLDVTVADGSITNLSEPYIVHTNFIRGQIYSNSYGKPIVVSAPAHLAVGSGDVATLSLWVLGGSDSITNRAILGSSVADVVERVMLIAAVPTNAVYTFTNDTADVGVAELVGNGQIFIPGNAAGLGGAGDVTAAGDNEFTGNNTHTGTEDFVDIDASGTINAAGVVTDNLYTGNLIATNLSFATNYLVAQTLDMNQLKVVTNLTANLTITSFVNASSTNVKSSTLLLIGHASNPFTVTVPSSVRTTDGIKTWTVTNATAGMLTVETWANIATNAAFRNLW